MGKVIKARFKIQSHKDLTPVLTLEVAETPAELQQGLMNRAVLQKYGGMLFIFPAEQCSGFWMKNTSIPLDLFPLANDGVVREFIRLHPFDETMKRIGAPARYVLELPVARPYVVQPGDRLLVMT